jgi:hypothetical protein
LRHAPLRRSVRQYNVKPLMPVSESFGIKVVDARTFLPVELPRLRARLFYWR